MSSGSGNPGLLLCNLELSVKVNVRLWQSVCVVSWQQIRVVLKAIKGRDWWRLLREINLPFSDREGNQKGVIFETGQSTGEETAIEVLGSFKVTRSETMASEFRVGDLVWGKIEAHPWWPGQIYDESLANSSVMQTKTKGCLLVAFFGDDTYSWIHPNNLLPYEPHFLSKSKQSKSELFKKAVEDAIKEVKERAEVAFTCQCQKPYDGYEYPVDQVERFRRELNPAEMVSFVHKLAFEPMNMPRDGHFMRNVARFLAYRTAVFAEDAVDNCPTYKEAFVGPDGYEDSNDCEEALLQGAASTNVSERVKFPAPTGKRKGSSSGHSWPNKARHQSKCAKIEKAVDGIKLPKSDYGKASRDHVSRNRPKCSQGSQDAFLDKEALVSKPSKSSSSIVPFDKDMGKTVRDPQKSRDKGKELASAILDKQALISESSKPLSSILLVEKAVGNSVRESEEYKLASPEGAEADVMEPGAILCIKFPSQAPLPSTSEIKAKFARFGRLDTSATYSSRKSSKCHVGFKRTFDAVSARDHLQRHGNMYNSTKVSCWLEGLEVNPSPKSSESTKLLGNPFTNPPHQWSSSGRASKSEGGRTEKYQQAIPPPALPCTPVYPEVSSPQEVSQLANVIIDKKHPETSQTAIDISGPLLKLLKEVDKYIENFKRTQKH